MKVSVVIPVYNEEKYLAKCLESLKTQEEPADEIIVVDNNSTDNTIGVAKKFGAKIFEEKKQGITFARNRGFDEAKFPIIARCDADSILPPNWIKMIKANFAKNKIIALSGPGYFYDMNSVLSDYYLNYNMYYFRISRLAQGFNTLFGSNMAFTKKGWLSIRDEICLDDKKVHEDMDLAIHLAKYGKIKYDKTFRAGVSSRRFKDKPLSVLVEYPLRWVSTIRSHKFR